MLEGTVCISIKEYDELRMAKKIMSKSYVKKLYKLCMEYIDMNETSSGVEYSKRCKLRNDLLNLLNKEVFEEI
jgi:TnpA family transposase